MLAHEIVTLLAPLKYALEKSSFNTMHKALQISDTSVSCRTSHIAIDIAAQLNIAEYKEPLHVDGASFLAILNSLPEGQELKLTHREGALHWNCGKTKGKMACLALPVMPSVEYLIPDEHTGSPPPDFIKALELGSLSADASSMASVGMAGVLIDSDRLLITTTDDVTISVAFLDTATLLLDAPVHVALSPDVIPLLTNLLSETGYWEIDDYTIKYTDGTRDMIVSQVSSLSKTDNVLNLIDKCMKGQQYFPIPADTIRAFMKRAEVLTNDRPQLSVSITVDTDRVTLIFDEATARTEEYFDIENSHITTPLTLRLNARKFMRALRYSEEIVIDFISERMLVLRSKPLDFMYIIGGS